MKKILGILGMSLFVFWFWVYADVIPMGSHRVSKCVVIQNPEIDEYRVVVVNDTVMNQDIYEPQAGECLRGHYHVWESNQYLVEKSIPLDELTVKNIEEKAEKKWSLGVNGYYEDDSNPIREVKKTYKIVKNGNIYDLELVEDPQNIEEPQNDIIEIDDTKEDDGITEIDDTNENDEADDIIETDDIIESRDLDNHIRTGLDFLIALVLTILIETWVLFIIKNLNWLTYSVSENWTIAKYPVKNAKVLLSWILASAITLPLLRYIFPLFLWDGMIYVIGGELLVFLIETVILKYIMNISRKKALVVSFICNLVSFLLGVFLEYLDFWLFSF